MSESPSAPPAVEFPDRAEPFDLSAFPCPRCDTVIAANLYGPCPSCIAELTAAQRGEGGDVQAAAYEPKMNVTPNAVATKD